MADRTAIQRRRALPDLQRDDAVSLAMEGKFSNGGLQGIEDDDDVLTAMASELVTHRGIGESASAVWKSVQEQHARLLLASSALDEELSEELVAGPFDEVVAVEGTVASLVFGARPEKESPRRRPLVVEPDCNPPHFSPS